MDDSGVPNIPTINSATDIGAGAKTAYDTNTIDKMGDHGLSWQKIFPDTRFGIPDVACESPPLIFTFSGKSFDMTVDFCDPTKAPGKMLLFIHTCMTWAMGIFATLYIWRRFMSAEQVAAID